MICRKCSQRQKGGFGKKGRTPLAKFLRKLLGMKKGRKSAIGIIETSCLDVCPRDAIVMIDSRCPARWLLVRPGSEPDAILAQLEA